MKEERDAEDKIVHALASQCQKLECVEFDKWARIEIKRDKNGHVMDFARALVK